MCFKKSYFFTSWNTCIEVDTCCVSCQFIKKTFTLVYLTLCWILVRTPSFSLILCLRIKSLATTAGVCVYPFIHLLISLFYQSIQHPCYYLFISLYCSMMEQL